MTARVRPTAGSEPRAKQNLRLWLRLLRTTRTIEAELRERLRVRFATTLPRFDALAALARAPQGMTMTALSRLLIVSNGNATGLIDRLVADGMVVRMAAENDRRATFVRLTRKGLTEFERMAAEHQVWIDELLGALDPAEAAMLDAVLARVTARKKESRDA